MRVIHVICSVVLVAFVATCWYTPTTKKYCHSEVGEVVDIVDSFFNYEPRQLGFSEWGNPEGYPVLHFHPQPASRLFIHPNINDTLQRKGIRLFILERPGIGLSSPWPFNSRSTLDWAKDVLQFVRIKNLRNVSIIGHSAGCPHALATAFALGDMVDSLTLMGPIIFKSSLSNRDAGHPAVEEFNPTEQMLKSSQPMYSFGASGNHWINRLMLNIFAPLLTSKVELSYADIAEIDVEKKIFDDTVWEEIFYDSVVECYRQGVSGMAQDLEACAQPFGFSLADLNIPVQIFVGSEDQFTPPAHAKLINQLIDHSTLKVIEGYGHWSLFSHYYSEILDSIPR